jgi:hypothetical protein
MTDIALALLEENKQLQATIDELKANLNRCMQPLNKASLYAKKAAVMANLSRIPESGKHQQGWKYSTSEDVKDPVREEMAKAGLSLAFELIDYEIIREEKRIIITGNVKFALQCSETGATENSIIPAEAVDWVKGGGATAEKTFFKLYTTAEKYYLKTTFLISSGDELDSDVDAPPKNGQKQQFGKTSPSKKTVSPPPWLPTLDEFLAKARENFIGLTDQDIKDELKEAGFSGFLSAEASKMMEALKERKET